MPAHNHPQVPPGFHPIELTLGGAFAHANGPLWMRNRGAGVQLGLLIDERHCNAMHICHGGLLATFADMLMPLVAFETVEPRPLRRALPTVSLQLDFIGPVRSGEFIVGEANVLKATRSLVFIQGLVRVGDHVVLRSSGVFKFGMDMNPDWPGIFVDADLKSAR